MNTNKLVTLLSVPVVMLAAAAQPAEARDIVSQLRSLSAGTRDFLCLPDIGDVDAYKAELGKRFSLYVFILNPDSLKAYNPETQAEIAEMLQEFSLLLSNEQVGDRLVALMEHDEGFQETVLQFGLTIRAAYSQLEPGHVRLIKALTSLQPDSCTALDKDRLVCLRLMMQCCLYLRDLTAESAQETALELRTLNNGIAVLLDRMSGKEKEAMSEDAAMLYLQQVEENAELFIVLSAMFNQDKEKLSEAVKDCPELLTEAQRSVILGSNMWSAAESGMITDVDKLIYKLSRGLPEDISSYERKVLMWHMLNLVYMENLYMVDSSDPAKSVEKLSTILSAMQRVLEQGMDEDDRRTSDAVVKQCHEVFLKMQATVEQVSASETVQVVMDTNSELRNNFLRYLLLQMNDAVDEAMDAAWLEATYSLISTLKNELPESFNEDDRTIFALYQIFLRTATLVGDSVEIDAEELVDLMKVHNAAGEQLLDRIRTNESGRMSKDATWIFVRSIYRNANLFDVFDKPNPQQTEHMRALTQACPEFTSELNRARNLANAIRHLEEYLQEDTEVTE